MLAADVRLAGSIACDGELHIDGIVNGDITARRLTIGAEAAIIGRLQAEEAWIAGSVHGEIAVGKLTIAKTGRVHADVKCAEIEIEPGAVTDIRRGE